MSPTCESPYALRSRRGTSSLRRGALDPGRTPVPNPSVVIRSLWLVVLVAACGKAGSNDPAPCAVVGAKVRTVARTELAAEKDLPPAQRSNAELQLGPLEHDIDKACRDQKWSVEVRKCMADATSGSAMKVCAGALSPSQRGALPEKVHP